jgi:hypothetical protein
VLSEPECGVAAVGEAGMVLAEPFVLLCSCDFDDSAAILRRDASESSNALDWLVLLASADVLIEEGISKREDLQSHGLSAH